jgi:hypothetical protein
MSFSQQSSTIPYTPIIQSQPQASKVFGGGGKTGASGMSPRRRHVFLMRFAVGHGVGNLSQLTYVVKHCDRPKIVPKTEELNQYNKKRVIYTGFKYEPIRITFYDSANGAAQNMWTQYARYYFGDFAKNANTGYGYDITSQTINNAGYGLSEPYLGNTDISSQWFFDNITIYHFYYMGGQQLFDSYTLYHPRISQYEPDELDYEQSNVSQINMSLIYENLQYSPGQTVGSVQGGFDEFVNGLFYNNSVPTTPNGLSPSGVGNTSINSLASSNPIISNLLKSVQSASPLSAAYRAASSAVTGALSSFGNYVYGSFTPQSLASQAVNGNVVNNISSNVGAVTGSYGSAGGNIASALQSTGTNLTGNANGTILPTAALGSLNSQANGTAQYGFNNGISTAVNPANYAQNLASSTSGAFF